MANEQSIEPEFPSQPSLRLSLGLVVIAVAAFAVLAVVLVPWDWVPGSSLVRVRGSEVFTAEELARGEAYSTAQRRLGWAGLALSLGLLLFLGLTRVGATLARRAPGPWWVRAPLATLAVLALVALLTSPLDLAMRRNRLDYGLTEQSLGGWVRDQLTSLGVAWVFASVMVLLVVATARTSPRRWPVWAALAGVVLTFLGSWVYPLLVEPLFNEFTPLAQGPLRTEILELARAEEVPVTEVLVADASRRTTTLNAWVSGIGNTRRVVLYDNLVQDVPRRETLAVVAHELGHARTHDVLIGTTLSAVGVAGGVGLLALLLRRRGLLRRAGVRHPGQPEVAALLLALTTTGTLLASPVENTVSRAIEARADRSALEATGDHEGFEELQRQLAVRALSDDDPPAWSQFWFGSHPTTLQRIGLSRALEQQSR